MAARLLRMFLTANGHAVEVVHDGLDGINAARRFRPEVLSGDIGLPGIDENSIARALREESSFKNTYLIAVSGYGQDSDQERELKADSFVASFLRSRSSLLKSIGLVR